MTGLEYMKTVCPTTSVGKDPLREDVVDAFEDGIAEGYKRCKENHWKPSEDQVEYLRHGIELFRRYASYCPVCLLDLYEDLKKL